MTNQYHSKSVSETFEELRSSPGGLTSEEAGRRLERYDPNEIAEKKGKTPFMLFIDQFRDFMVIVLVVAAVISGIIGEVSDTIAIAVIVILNATLGFVQEFRAEKAMAALKKMAAPSAIVVRDGLHKAIRASELVPGDIVMLEAGNIIPADMRLVEAVRLKVDEAALTGESVPVDKHVNAIPDKELPVADRKNMVYKGTNATYGRGTGIVTSTGMKTELGRIAAMLQGEAEVKTPLQKKLQVFGRRLALLILLICAVIFVSGLLRGEQPLLMFLTAVSLAVAAIPEALPAVVTITLAIGARKMVRQNALVRKLHAVETLGSVTYICSDKTGTLTKNRMTVETVYVDGRMAGVGDWGPGEDSQPYDPRSFFLTALALNNDAYEDAENRILGDPTEVALYSLAKDNGFDRNVLEGALPRVGEIPFDSERKCMTTIHESSPSSPLRNDDNIGFISITKGAVDVIAEKADSILTCEGVRDIDKRKLLMANEEMAAQGLRVLCVAMRNWEGLPEEIVPEILENGLTVLGLAGIMDPPREEAKEAVFMCKSAGIKPVMITGDHQLTARTIAARLDILDDDTGAVITGRELADLPMDVFEDKVEDIKVYARVAPEQKLKIVKALQDKGQFVAMTGDGVNDAPALKRADIGIAMGITGTDVSKEASHMILLDDNFATIVKAVKEGRRIYDNIRKFIRYLLTTNSGEVLTVFLAPFFGLPIPLQPIHILWINLITDGLPAVALSVEPEEGDVMARPPRNPGETIFARGLGYQVLWVGMLMAGATLSLQAWSLNAGVGHWQTMVFTVLCFLQLGNVLAIRSETESVFKQGLMSNKPLMLSVLFSIALQLSIIYVPVLNSVFRTQPLTFRELSIVFTLSSVVFFAVEAEKFFKRKRARQPHPSSPC
ncbi:MAG TPA: cation-translocating P-type ATPase [Nitrospirae bacterium]|nr:cation-translocating P-type ATPase [Nitrospirota bacterium]HDZ88449.1 cation-translocating P-type ATPase [Nitrospirota bacterium]